MKLWTELNDVEKRVAIARRLGLPVGTLCSEKNVHFVPDSWGLTQSYHCSVCSWEEDGDSAKYGQWEPHPYTPADWPTNDGLAFVEVWPKLCELGEPRTSLDSTRSQAREAQVTIYSHPQENAVSIRYLHGLTWADAICQAAYALLPEVPDATP